MKLFNILAVLLLSMGVSWSLGALTPGESFLGFMKQHTAQLCQKPGMFSGMKSLRSDAGKFCKSPVGAVVALALCQDKYDFANSECDKAARRELAGLRDAKKQLNLELMFKADRICGALASFLPDEVKFLSDCKYYSKPAVETPKAAPAKPTAPKPSAKLIAPKPDLED